MSDLTQVNKDDDSDDDAKIEKPENEKNDAIEEDGKPVVLFDVDSFMRLLLGSQELDNKMMTIHRSMLKVAFYLPLYNKRLLESGKTLSDTFDDICFVQSPDNHEHLISWSGLPMIHRLSSEWIQILPRVYPNPPDLKEIILNADIRKRSEFYNKIFRNIDGVKKNKKQIMAGFSVNAESLEGSVYLVDEENILGWRERKSVTSLSSTDSLHLVSHLLNDQETLIARLRHPESKTIVTQIKK